MMHHRTAKEVRPVPGSTRKDCGSACGHGEMVMGQKCIIFHLEGEEMPKQPVSARPCLDVDNNVGLMDAGPTCRCQKHREQRTNRSTELR